jgi:pilus assembly protein CpaB
MQKQRIILIVGIILAVVVVFLIKIYLDQQRQALEAAARQKAARMQENQTSVLVAKQDIPKGTAISPELFEPKIVPKEYAAPSAVTSVDRIDGMIAVVSIAKGEQISLNKLTVARETSSGGGLAESTPVGKRAITITVDNMASVAGMVRPGNYVDVIATIPVPAVSPEGKQIVQAATVPLFQNVLILAVGQQISTVSASEGARYTKDGQKQPQPQPQQPQAGSLITIALTPQEASIVAFVQEQGKLRLVLRSPADSQVQPTRPINWEALFQYLAPPEAVKQASKPESAEPMAYVEIYRGLKKEKVPLSK